MGSARVGSNPAADVNNLFAKYSYLFTYYIANECMIDSMLSTSNSERQLNE